MEKRKSDLQRYIEKRKAADSVFARDFEIGFQCFKKIATNGYKAKRTIWKDSTE